MRYALLVEYDGTDFHGSQLQAGVRTVQGELEKALQRIYGSALRVSMASRTDAGVHATAQVAAFDADNRHEPVTLRKALNFHLPDDVAVSAVEGVAEEFDPRRQALRRHYLFRLNDGPTPGPLMRWTEVRTKDRLDASSMNTAAHFYVGSHDFASFAGPATPEGASTVRHIDSVRIERTSEYRIEVRIAGNAFLHQQVRRMTGALARVGSGKLTDQDLKNLVEQPRRGAAGWPLPAKGLCLTRIEYGKDGPFQSETEYN